VAGGLVIQILPQGLQADLEQGRILVVAVQAQQETTGL
jgi:hypothetical protein